MAKGLRSSGIKKNKSKLRAKVFGPVEAARLKRLSQKQADIAAAKRPTEDENDMEVDGEGNKKEPEAGKSSSIKQVQSVDELEEMDVDGSTKLSGKALAKIDKARKEARTEKKKKHRKARNLISFPQKKRNPTSNRRQPRI